MSVLYEDTTESWEGVVGAPHRAPAAADILSAASRNTVVLHVEEPLSGNLHGLTDLATQIYAQVRAGRQVVAVVAASDGVTRPLLRACAELGVRHDNVNAPAFVELAHARCAAALALACDRAGLCATARTSSDPVSRDAFAQHDVIVIPAAPYDARSSAIALANELGAERTSIQTTLPAAPRTRVALAGLGVVGAGVATRLLHQPARYEICGALVRDPSKARDVDLNRDVLITSPDDLIATRPDVIIDLLSDGALGAELSERALRVGISVVSANKQAIAAAYEPLKTAARLTGASLRYSAAVGGSAPILETVRHARAAHAEIYAIEGVLNGTVNFVLGLLARGKCLTDALAAARGAGLAEEDATMDLSGRDAAAKLDLVAREAFNRPLSDLNVEPLTPALAEHARETPLKQVSRIVVRDGVARGEVVFEPAAHGPFAELGGDRNAICISSRDGRQWRARGRGAGRWPTTESVMADVLEFAEQIR